MGQTAEYRELVAQRQKSLEALVPRPNLTDDDATTIYRSQQLLRLRPGDYGHEI